MSITDRTIYTLPTLPTLGAAGYQFTDPTFGSRMVRVTDSTFTADIDASTNYSFRSPASSYQQAWSTDGTKVTVLRQDGNVVICTFNPDTLATARLGNVMPPLGNGTTTFDSVNSNYMYGVGVAANHHTIVRVDVSQVPITTSTFLDLDTIQGGLTDTYIGALNEGSGCMMCTFGGASQEEMRYVLHYPMADPASKKILDTRTRNDQDEFDTYYYIHSAQIDASGRFVTLVSTTATIGGVDPAPYRLYIWDTLLDTVQPLTPNSTNGGHEVSGWLARVCNSPLGAFDSHQWAVTPTLAEPNSNRYELIDPLMLPQEVYAADHSSWNNARSDSLQPFVTATYRYNDGPIDVTENTCPWRAWDNEIMMISTDSAVPAADRVRRYAHHRGPGWRREGEAGADIFWYTPRPNISNDGRFVLFTSIWDFSLGTEYFTDLTRQDAFIVEIAENSLSDSRVVVSRPGRRFFAR